MAIDWSTAFGKHYANPFEPPTWIASFPTSNIPFAGYDGFMGYMPCDSETDDNIHHHIVLETWDGFRKTVTVDSYTAQSPYYKLVTMEPLSFKPIDASNETVTTCTVRIFHKQHGSQFLFKEHTPPKK